jgi:hypothetical protein
MQAPPAARSFPHSPSAPDRLFSETRTTNAEPDPRRAYMTNGKRSARTAGYLRRSRS